MASICGRTSVVRPCRCRSPYHTAGSFLTPQVAQLILAYESRLEFESHEDYPHKNFFKGEGNVRQNAKKHMVSFIESRVLITLSLGGCGGTASPPTAEEPAAEEPAAQEPVEEEEPVEKDVANWTFMIYLDADNYLETAGIRDFLEMAAVGSSPEVNIVLQMDRIDKEKQLIW